MQQIFYITLDPERALGVEDLFPSFHILYSENSQLSLPIANSGIDIKNFPKLSNTKINSTSKMLENPSLLNYIKNNSHGIADILVFKNDKQILEQANLNNLKLINPDPELSIKLENKVFFSEYVENTKTFDQPDYVIFEKLSESKYEELVKKFGNEFVVQFIFGHTGSGTFFIKSEAEFKKLQNSYPLRKGKISKKINGITYTVNACIVRDGVVIGGISEQITGIPELTSSLGGTVGNDFSQRHLNDVLRSEIIEKTILFGECLRTQNHKGIFGLDFIIEEKTNKIYLIEANIRQVASCTYVSYLQRMNKIAPIMLWHICELLNFDFDQRFISLSENDEEWINDELQSFRLSNDKLSWNIERNKPIQASQILFRNTQPNQIQILDQFPSGIYRVRGRKPHDAALLEDENEYIETYKLTEDGYSNLCLKSRGYNIIEADNLDGFIINVAPEKSLIDVHGEIGRIQILQSAFSSKEDKHPNGIFMDIIKCIYDNIHIIKYNSVDN